MPLATAGAWLFVSVFYVLPLLAVAALAALDRANLIAVIALFTWMGLGVLLGVAMMGETLEG